MPFNFDRPTDRCGTFSMKWDVLEGELPMWVADMDFETAPAVIDALRRKVEKGVFGYTVVPDEYYEAVTDWWRKRYNFRLAKDEILFSAGVVPAISSIVRKLTTPAENVLIQPPVYNIFYNSILNNGRNVLENRLVYKDGIYGIDFADLEQKLSNPQTTMMILCNPHNPVGKVWSKETLAQIGELCAKHHVVVVSDEIHCDLTRPGLTYTPFASASDLCRQNSITCTAPSKAFNLAGLHTAGIIVPNPVLRHKVNRGLNTDEVAEPNAFAIEATIAAYTEGEDWLDELRAYIHDNINTATEYICQNIPDVRAVKPEATYLLWLDCQKITCTGAAALRDVIRKEAGLYLSDGADYGENGKSFLRMNLGTQRNRVLEGLVRLKQGIRRYNDIVADEINRRP